MKLVHKHQPYFHLKLIYNRTSRPILTTELEKLNTLLKLLAEITALFGILIKSEEIYLFNL